MDPENMDAKVLIELIKILPTLIWGAIVIGIVVAFYRPIKRQLLPRMTELKAFGIEAAFVKAELDRAAETVPAGPQPSRDRVARRAERLASVLKGAQVLFVNDVPSQMKNVISILESLGIGVSVATDTGQALQALRSSDFDAVVSDMRRGSVEDEGERFLRKMRDSGFHLPTIFTVGDYRPELGTPPYALGITNRVDELLNLVFDALERTRG